MIQRLALFLKTFVVIFVDVDYSCRPLEVSRTVSDLEQTGKPVLYDVVLFLLSVVEDNKLRGRNLDSCPAEDIQIPLGDFLLVKL